MTDDWPQIKARLERDASDDMCESTVHQSDIRAALQRVAQLEEDIERGQLWRKRDKALRQRVEELEQEKERITSDWARWEVECTARIKAAEAKLREYEEDTFPRAERRFADAVARAEAAEAKLAEIRLELRKGDARDLPRTNVQMIRDLRQRIEELEQPKQYTWTAAGGLPPQAHVTCFTAVDDMRKRAEAAEAKLAQVVEAARHLRVAVTFGPMTNLSPESAEPNPGWEARIPAGFIETLDATLAAAKGE